MKRPLRVGLVLLLGWCTPALAQLPVTDVGNLLQNTIQAAQAVIMVANQVLELTGLDEIVLGDDLGADLGQLAELGQDAQGLEADLANIHLQITLLFDLQTAPNSSAALRDRLAAIRQLTWQAYVDALRTESLLQSSVSALRHMVRLIEGLGAFLGNQQGNQTLAQMEAKLTVELIKLRTQTAAFHRAQALDRLEPLLVEQSIRNINQAIMEDYPQ
ncbi:MAG TPA: hypothetical protein VLQ80_11700 [Candidatus Saccharimonadia bacterium]|nr:hypothetical protein [Candidatus Saccharimonadia bacterium]